jgi:hypothetical protein
MQPSDDWKEAIKNWYKSNGLSEPRDHDTPSVSDNLGPMQLLSLRAPYTTFDWSHIDVRKRASGKPFLTAVDICFLRDMKVGL